MRVKNATSAKLILILIGIITIIVGGFIAYRNFNAMNNYDQVTASIIVKRDINISRNDNHDVYVTYTYGDITYENVKLGSYDSTKMTNGRTITLYVNPDSPYDPYYLDWTMVPIVLVAGALVLVWGITIKSKDE